PPSTSNALRLLVRHSSESGRVCKWNYPPPSPASLGGDGRRGGATPLIRALGFLRRTAKHHAQNHLNSVFARLRCQLRYCVTLSTWSSNLVWGNRSSSSRKSISHWAFSGTNICPRSNIAETIDNRTILSPVGVMGTALMSWRCFRS